MDVPYHSSGAISRAHYTIVRKVETSDSVHSADQHIILEIESIKTQLAQSRLDNAKCKECLVILLYCALTCSPGVLPTTAFNFAFFPAINLAERGRTLDDKRIGYRFCMELMPLKHEAGLMLVNTLRKDLESEKIPYICLALDSLLALPTEHMIAAVQDRLNQLIDHDSPLVRRRTLLAFRSLAAQNPLVLERIKNVVLLSLHDEDESVSHSALSLLSQSDAVDRIKFQQAVKEVLSNKLASLNLMNLESASNIMAYLKIVSPVNGYIPILFKILGQNAKTCSNTTSRTLIVDVFRILSSLDPETYSKAEREQNVSAVRVIRTFLKSSQPDDIYIFFAALECVPVAAWAGTDADHPAVLSEDEFLRMLGFLNHPDPIIRMKVMRVIQQVDPNVLNSHITLLREAMKPSNGVIDLHCCLQALEALRIRYTDDGSKYAEMTLALLQDVSQTSTPSQVFEAIVDCILRDEALNSRQEFGSAFARTFLASLSDNSCLEPGPTTLVISSALAVEFAPILGITAADSLLMALGSRLTSCTASVQEPCILAMIRLCAEVGEIQPTTTSLITELAEKAPRSVRKYCKLFLEFGRDKHALQEIIHNCQSSSLPDFLVALSLYRTRLRHLASNQRSQTSSPASRTSLDQTRSGPSSRAPSQLKFETSEHRPEINLQASRLDLISLESPFHNQSSGVDFGEIWDSLNPNLEVRGWSLAPVGVIVDNIVGLNDHEVKILPSELSPFAGELKLVITSSSSVGALALRLRQADDDSCLYRMRFDERVTAAKQLVIEIMSPS